MRINEMFYSIQGEGYYTGTPAVFIRLSGCNLACPFCDTEHGKGVDMTEDEIADFAAKYNASLVVITGGEPTLQLTESLVDKLHKLGKYVAIETNGTHTIPANVDWITVSPKETYVGNIGKVMIRKANEVKVVFDSKKPIKDPTFGIMADHYYAQPCDTGFIRPNKENMNYCIDFVKNNPLWKISIQTQKILNVQ